MERYAKSIAVLVVGLLAYLAAKAGVEIPTDQLEVVVVELITAAVVYEVPNRG